jgi:hypothetical protein
MYITIGALIAIKMIITKFNGDCKVNEVGITPVSTPVSIKKFFSEFRSSGMELDRPNTQLLKEKYTQAIKYG